MSWSSTPTVSRALLAGLTLACIFSVRLCLAEGDGVAAPDSVSWRDLAPRLFLQNEAWCDEEYIKSEITFVSYVRDQKEADVHLTITAQETAGGGSEYTLAFRGRGEFSDLDYTLKHCTAADVTEDETREGLVATIRRGLAPFLDRTDLRDYLSVDFTGEAGPAEVADQWKSWVFEVGVDGFAHGERLSSHLWYNISAEVSRVTRTTRFGLEGDVNADEDRYELEDTTYRASKKSYYGELSYTHGLGEHLTVGGWLEYEKSAYRNIQLGFTASPAVEYSILPYSEYAEHEFYARYKLYGMHRQYCDTTLFDKMRENLLREAVTVGVLLTRSWGTTGLSVTGSHYFHDLSKNRISLDASARLRVFAGLSLRLYAGYSFIHDQLALRKEGASEEEQLLRLRELETGYDYWVSAGVSYTFGSIFSNIVNPRF